MLAHQPPHLLARQDTSMAERLLGSVATEVVRRAACDVLVVRPPDAAQPATDGSTGTDQPPA